MRCLTVTLSAMLVAATATAGAAAPHESGHAYVGYPSSIAVLGHSGATGENSDPRRPGVEVRANSWATGTNPAVNSLYLRILAKDPTIRGHNVNLAQGGATVQQLVLQAQHAVSLKPKPDLFVIQIMDSDIVCPATARDYAAFRSTFVSALDGAGRRRARVEHLRRQPVRKPRYVRQIADTCTASSIRRYRPM